MIFRELPMGCEFFIALICIIIFLLLLPLVKIVLKYSLGKWLYSRRHLLKGAGEWAIITGSNAGIGKAFAEELASDGLNIMLIDRYKEGLETVSASLESTYNVKTRTVVADFFDPDVYEELGRKINSLPSIACLINNVGICYEIPDDFATGEVCSLEFIRQLINCNVHSVAAMTRIVMPKMLKDGTSGGAIVNIASASGMVTAPLLTLYAGSKAFVKHFTVCLAAELSNRNITIQCYHPCFVATQMAKARSVSITTPHPKVFARSALNMLGVDLCLCGYFWHELVLWLIKFSSASRRKARILTLRQMTLTLKQKRS